MAIPLDPNQLVSFEELLMSQVVQQEVLARFLVEKGDIHQGGVFGDGKGGRPGDEEEKVGR